MSIRLRILALVDLGVRYCSTAAYHWRRRHECAAAGYTAAEAEFLPASISLVETPVSPTARVTGALLVLLILFAILWALIAKVDIVVTASGKIIPTSRTKIITSVEVASVRSIHVVEGQKVKAGDLLVELDAGISEADEHRANAEVSAASLEMARASALIAAIEGRRAPVLGLITNVGSEDYEQTKSHLNGQYLDYRAKLTEIEGEIERYSRALPLAQERLRQYQELAKTHHVSADALSEKLEAAIELEGQLLRAQNARMSLIAQTRRQALDVLAQARQKVATASQEAARARARARLLTLRAPVDGSVQQLSVHTIGGAVPAAQPLMLIVPQDDQLEAEAYVDNKDIGFVREGQSVALKADAFDYTKHGFVQGEVLSISRDALEDQARGLIYKIRVKLDHPFILVEGQAKELAPGMTVNAEIKTGTRRVIEYFVSPLLKHGHESLNER